MAAGYDYVILDSAPVLPVADSVALARVVDGVLVVTQANRVSARDVRGAFERLERVGRAADRRRAQPGAGGGTEGGYGYGYGYGYVTEDRVTRRRADDADPGQASTGRHRRRHRPAARPRANPMTSHRSARVTPPPCDERWSSPWSAWLR